RRGGPHDEGHGNLVAGAVSRTASIALIACLALVATLAQSCYQRTSQGEQLYTNHCANCHGSQGEGLQQLIPPLAGADFLEQQPEKLACIIRYGQETPMMVNGVRYDQPMPANLELTDLQVVNLVNYIRKEWGNDLSFRSADLIREDLRTCREERHQSD
ncbi:MAG: cytochrome c, partial [Bacteroidota bacterium]